MNYQQKEIADNLWNNYQKFKNISIFNNSKFVESNPFYDFQEYMNNQDSLHVYPILDYYIEYAINNEYEMIVYLLYSPFLWENIGYRYQLSKIIYYIKNIPALSEFILSEKYDDYFLGLVLNRVKHPSIAYGSSNSLNIWFYLGSYNLITDTLTSDMEANLNENMIPFLVDQFYSHAKITSDEINDWYTIYDGFTALVYNIYSISFNKRFKSDYVSDFLHEINNLIKYLYDNAEPSVYRFFKNVDEENQFHKVIDESCYDYYKNLFIKYGYHISDNTFPGIILLTRMLEDVIDYFLANIPYIFRTEDGSIQLGINEYLKIFHCLFGVGTHELYVIANS